VELGVNPTRPSDGAASEVSSTVSPTDASAASVPSGEGTRRGKHLGSMILLAAEHDGLPREIGRAQSGLVDLRDVVGERLSG